MPNVPLPKTAGAEHLTLALRRSGTLGSGRVRDVALASSIVKLRSHTVRLRLTYDGEAAGAPNSVILKTGNPDGVGPSRDGGRREVTFYGEVAPGMIARTVPRCFEAAWDPVDGWHILLEDLTESHVIATEWPLPPMMEQCLGIVEAHARSHAAWWDDPRLGASIGRWAAPDDQVVRSFAARFERFADRHGELLSSDRRALFERLIERSPDLLARRHARRNVTVIHGDAHVWNCFVPRNGAGDTLLLDWENWGIGSATDDLAYMMAMHWYPDRRRRLEAFLLDHYHAVLTANGVSGYGRHDLDDDYRLSALIQIARPIWQEAFKIPPRVWWHNLERALLAIDDLACHELLL